MIWGIPGSKLSRPVQTWLRKSTSLTRFIGAGVTGLYSLYRLRQLGFSVRAFEEDGGVGGTWYWNRHPGCRFYSESYTYGYSFSEELLQEWDWKEHYSSSLENERYLNFLADKFDLRRDIRLNSRVVSAVFDEDESRWQVQLEDGHACGGGGQRLGRIFAAINLR